MQIPEYRLRLFLSVDLAGSTAFKNGPGSIHKEEDPYPLWVSSIRAFYRDFPILVAQDFKKVVVAQRPAMDYGFAPTLWKSIGDELIFCTRLNNYEHLAGCVVAFLHALDSYGHTLDQGGKHMDVKGAGWIAAFPAPNVTVTSIELRNKSDYLAETLEEGADAEPAKYDFLGRDIDSGFRVARFASSDKFVASVELAWLLAEAHRDKLVECNFGYHGRQILKGVLRDRPYPLISLDTERNSSRRDVRTYESGLLPSVVPDSTKIRDFCRAFMLDEGIEFPHLKRYNIPAIPDELPATYKLFRRSAQATLEGNQKLEQAEREAAADIGSGSDELPDAVVRLTDRQVRETEPEADGEPSSR